MSPFLLRMDPYEFLPGAEEEAPAAVRAPPKRPEEPVTEAAAP